MNEWVYKATTTKVDYHATRDLAVLKHFLCRSAVESNGSRADGVEAVKLGDIIHFYYRQPSGKVPSFGSFLVIDGAAYPTQFGRQIPGTALFEVLETPENAKMVHLLTKQHQDDPTKGYVRDPEHECFTGWVIKRFDSTEKKPPDFDQSTMLPGAMINLWHYPDPELPRPPKQGRK